SRWARVSGISPCAPRSPTEEEYWRAAPSACIENRNGLRHLRCSTTWLHRGPDRRISEVVARTTTNKISMTSSNLPLVKPLPDWTPRSAPPRTPIEGRFCRAEALYPDRHAHELSAANQLDAEGSNWTYLSVGPFNDFADYRSWLDKIAR